MNWGSYRSRRTCRLYEPTKGHLERTSVRFGQCCPPDKTLGVLSFIPFTMLPASAYTVDFKFRRHFGEGQGLPPGVSFFASRSLLWLAEAVPPVAVPHTQGDAKLAVRHAAPVAYVLAAIYVGGR